MQQLQDNHAVHQSIQEMTMAVTKVAPPVTATAWIVSGHSLQDWLVLATLIYTCVQLALLLEKRFRLQHRRARDKKSTN